MVTYVKMTGDPGCVTVTVRVTGVPLTVTRLVCTTVDPGAVVVAVTVIVLTYVDTCVDTAVVTNVSTVVIVETSAVWLRYVT